MTIDGRELLLRVEMWCARYWAEAMAGRAMLARVMVHTLTAKHQTATTLILGLLICEVDVDIVGWRRAWKQVRALRETGRKIEFIEETKR